ncbi:MAG TPA: energy transducer TonB [Polyangiaceae bacterium]
MARFLALAFAASGILHGVAYASLGFAPQRSPAKLPAASVAFEVRQAEPFETKPEPPKPAPDEPKPVERRAAAAVAAPKPAAAPEPARAPVDLSGVTLTNADGAGDFAMPAGDGSERTGPLGPLGPKPVASAALPAAAVPVAAAPGLSELVASKDLSERPRPPSLDGALRSLYPEEARRRAISGNASLRVRIGSDGRVKQASTMTESFAGFGDACRKAVLGSRWTAPRDRDGRAVQTEVRYTCVFVVD